MLLKENHQQQGDVMQPDVKWHSCESHEVDYFKRRTILEAYCSPYNSNLSIFLKFIQELNITFNFHILLLIVTFNVTSMRQDS